VDGGPPQKGAYFRTNGRPRGSGALPPAPKKNGHPKVPATKKALAGLSLHYM
jgi:hypothetical protein